VHRNVGAGSHGDANICLCECRGIIDPITDHRNRVTAILQIGDYPNLVDWKDSCDDVLFIRVDSNLTRDSDGGLAIISGQEHWSKSQIPQIADCRCATRFRSISDNAHSFG
jgi:hypothetical protein